MRASLTAGLPDDAFATDGLLTKRVLRAHALALLAPTGDEVLWDLGAGSGSISVEWCRLHAGNTAVAVERDAERGARVATNAETYGCAGRVRLVLGSSADVIGDLPRPDAVFIGGGLRAELLERCWEVLPTGGRLVANSVTAESDALLVEAHRRWGGELTRIGVETAAPIGRLTGFVPARTVTAWGVVR